MRGVLTHLSIGKSMRLSSRRAARKNGENVRIANRIDLVMPNN